MNYRTSREIRKIAEELIREHHRHLVNTRIEFLFSDKSTTSGGQDVYAKTSKVSGLNAFLASENEYPTAWTAEDENDGRAEPFFVMVVAEPLWRDLEPNQQKALIDHELCHLERDAETEKLSIRGHFIEEFPEVIRRHGLWRREVEVFSNATERAGGQLTIDDAGEASKDDHEGDVEATLEYGGETSVSFSPNDMAKIAEGGKHLSESGVSR